jgi:hypothetical protein
VPLRPSAAVQAGSPTGRDGRRAGPPPTLRRAQEP